MNWLAHLRLARQTPLDRLGQLSGDFVRGPLTDDLHPLIRRGVREHRSLDVWVDDHPLMRELRQEIPREFRRFAGILLDLTTDHVLARDWQSLAPGPGLEPFARQVAEDVQEHLDLCPERLAAIGRRRDIGSLLLSYEAIEGLELAIDRIGRRFRRPIDLTPSMAWIVDHEARLTEVTRVLVRDAERFLANRRSQEDEEGRVESAAIETGD
ncbi:MAG: ACP phosphodiesterase [Planctomycetota bacterium]